MVCALVEEVRLEVRVLQVDAGQQTRLVEHEGVELEVGPTSWCRRFAVDALAQGVLHDGADRAVLGAAMSVASARRWSSMFTVVRTRASKTWPAAHHDAPKDAPRLPATIT
jgi:hypothetical protein